MAESSRNGPDRAAGRMITCGGTIFAGLPGARAHRAHRIADSAVPRPARALADALRHQENRAHNLDDERLADVSKESALPRLQWPRGSTQTCDISLTPDPASAFRDSRKPSKSCLTSVFPEMENVTSSRVIRTTRLDPPRGKRQFRQVSRVA